MGRSAAAPAGPATVELYRDHRAALAVLGTLESAAAALPEKGAIPGDVRERIHGAAAFLARDLPLHFRREDDVLFPALDLPRDMGPLAQMAYEHDVIGALCGRDFPAALAAIMAPNGAAPAGIRAFRRIVAELAAVLRDHIAKEDLILFPLADQQLRPSEASEVAARMDAIRDGRWTVPV